MSHRLHPNTLVESAVEASYYLAPIDPGLHLEELISVGDKLGLKRGQISDAVAESDSLERLASGRFGLAQDKPNLYLNISTQWDGNPRNAAAYQNIAHAIRDHLATHGKRNKIIRLDDIYAAVKNSSHEVAVELAMMQLSGLFRASGQILSLTDFGVAHFQDFEEVSVGKLILSRPFFEQIFNEVRLIVLARGQLVTDRIIQKVHSAMPASAINKSGIFFSHASKNSDITNDFVEQILQLGIGVHRDDIFNVSNADQGIPAGQYFIPYIRDKVQRATAIIAWITPQFLARPFCMCELGAAWALLPENFFPILHEVTHDQLEGVLQGMQVFTANKKPDMNRFRDQLVSALSMQAGQRSTTWERHRDAFFTKHM